jgi:hypothetical protein
LNLDPGLSLPYNDTFYVIDLVNASAPLMGQMVYGTTYDDSGNILTPGSPLANNAIFTDATSGVQFRINYNLAGDPLGSGKDVALTVVPEPSSIALLALAAMIPLRRRRRV